MPLAAQNQLRLVCLNRREYPDSKPFTEEELRQFDSLDERQHDEFFDDRAQELTEFLADFAEKENLPKACADRGGIAVMGWSAGNLYTLCLLSQASAVKDATRERLEPFLRSMVIFGTDNLLTDRMLSLSKPCRYAWIHSRTSAHLARKVHPFGYGLHCRREGQNVWPLGQCLLHSSERQLPSDRGSTIHARRGRRCDDIEVNQSGIPVDGLS